METEQIAETKDKFMSYVMVRGSVPIFWEQKGLIEDVVITKNSELTHRSFKKHFEELIKIYNDMYCVDLLSDTKAREIILTKEYIKQIFISPAALKEHIRFEHFDFHGYCSGDRYPRLKVMLGRLIGGFKDFRFFIEDLTSKDILQC